MPTSKKISPYGNVKFKTVDEYFDSLAAFQRERLEELRTIIKSVIPKAEEVISYNMPAFKQNAVLVFYAAYSNHIGFYPTSSPINIFEKELSDYKVSKGAIQFPIDKKIPKALVKKIVKFRAEDDVAKQKAKAKK
ncbi:MAG: DUF1801 domain-containing protein [Parafilimonas sp.]